MRVKTVRMPESLIDEIAEYREANADSPVNAPDEAEAIRELIRRGLQDTQLKA